MPRASIFAYVPAPTFHETMSSSQLMGAAISGEVSTTSPGVAPGVWANWEKSFNPMNRVRLLAAAWRGVQQPETRTVLITARQRTKRISSGTSKYVALFGRRTFGLHSLARKLA